MCGKLAEIAFASETSLRHTRCTRVLCRRRSPRRHKTSASILAFVGGRLHTRHTAHESHAYRLLRPKKKIYNSEEARARDEGDGTVQIRDPEPTTALSFGQGQRSSMHCIRAVSDPQRFSPPKPLSTFRAISMMTSIEQSSMRDKYLSPASHGQQAANLKVLFRSHVRATSGRAFKRQVKKNRANKCHRAYNVRSRNSSKINECTADLKQEVET